MGLASFNRARRLAAEAAAQKDKKPVAGEQSTEAVVEDSASKPKSNGKKAGK